jgi:hypothetical protein
MSSNTGFTKGSGFKKEFTKVQKAFALYWNWLHETRHNNDEKSWGDYTEKTIAQYREIRDTMTEEEKKEIDAKATLFAVN